MKILLAHYKFYIQGGPERYMFKFMELAKSNGVEVIPFSINYPQNKESFYSPYFANANSRRDDGIYKNHMSLMEATKAAWHEFHNMDAAKKLRLLIKKEKPDMMYVLIPGELTTDIFYEAKKAGIPIIIRLSDFRLICGKHILLNNENICERCIHGAYFNMAKNRCIKNSFMLSILRSLSCYYVRMFNRYKYVDAVITPPEFTRKKIVESGFFKKEKVYSNPTFMDCSFIEPCYKHDNYILCLGRFSIEKGFMYVIKAMQYLKDLPIKVAITGDYENASTELKALINQLDIKDKVMFVGFLHGDKLKDVIKNSMCVACPAIWYENLPNVVLESYAYGKPVIASRVGSLEEIVEDEKTGLLFEPKNSQQIAGCIRRLYLNPDLCKELGKNARKKCEEEFSSQLHWDNFMKIYNDILLKRR